MSTAAAIREAIDYASLVCDRYLADLTDAELLHRPCVGCNHINWQVGHLVLSEHDLLELIQPGSMPPLPDRFRERYDRAAAGCDEPSAFLPKDELLAAYRNQRAATLRLLDVMAEEDFGRPTGIEYAPTVQSVFLTQSVHWLMHSGQWAVVRRQLGRPPLF
jgi:hypothetical protein